MAGVVISRRLSSSIKSTSLFACFKTLTSPSPTPPFHHLLNPSPIPIPSRSPFPNLYSSRSFSTNQQQHQQQQQQQQEETKSEDGFKHQEIEGPTVERDISPLANETREVTEKLIKNINAASRAMAAMCLLQLGIGAWLSYAAPMPPLPTLMNAVAFSFPFSMALMLRSTLKPMHFFTKMEVVGRLQILTSTMQIAKHLNLFFFRLQGVSYLCVAGLSIGTLFFAFAR